MVVKVFILGRPGSGKSTAINWITELANRRNYSVTYIKDYDILYDMYQKDIKQEKFVSAPYGGFDVVDFSVLDDTLKQIEQQLEKQIQEQSSATQKEIVLIEFARDDYDKALENFSSEFLKGAYFLFLDLDLEMCIERIRLRRDNTSPVHIRHDNDASKIDRHFVSDSIMKNYYRINNWSETRMLSAQNHTPQHVKRLDNSGDWETFLSQVSDFAETIFDKEFGSNKLPENTSSENPSLAQLESESRAIFKEEFCENSLKSHSLENQPSENPSSAQLTSEEVLVVA